jgi:polysaccharide biosynthesis transport protein
MFADNEKQISGIL